MDYTKQKVQGMIKTFPELQEQALVIIIEEKPLSNIYNRVIVNDEQFKQIVEILNQKKDGGFLIETYTDRFIVEDYVDLAED